MGTKKAPGVDPGASNRLRRMGYSYRESLPRYRFSRPAANSISFAQRPFCTHSTRLALGLVLELVARAQPPARVACR